MRAERQSRELRDGSSGLAGKLRVCVQSGAYRRSTNCQLIQSGQDGLDPLDVARDQTGPTRHLLPDRERRRVLQVRTADFDYIAKLVGLRLESVVQLPHRR